MAHFIFVKVSACSHGPSIFIMGGDMGSHLS